MSRKHRRPPFLAAYRLATHAAEPFAPLLLRARAKRGKEDPSASPNGWATPPFRVRLARSSGCTASASARPCRCCR